MKCSSSVRPARTLDKTATTQDLRKFADVREFSSWRRLEITKTEAGFHEISEGIRLRPIYRISWRRKPATIFKRLFLHGKIRSGKFVKLPADGIILPQEVRSKYTGGGKNQAINESAVFLSTYLADASLTAILAIQTAESWLELHHWRTSWTKLGLSRLSVCCF